MKPNVGVVYGDPGGRAAIEPVVRFLKADGRVEVSLATWKDDLYLIGTSDGVDWATHALLLNSYEYGIPTLAVMDFWSNYRERFELYPDKIAIIDEQMRTEMIAEGFPPEKLVITGQPAFDSLAEERKRFDESDKWAQPLRFAARRAYGLHPYDKLVIFMSQPISALGYDWGYTEHDVIPLLIDTLAVVAPDCQVLIKPHPREDPKGLYKYERERPHVKIRSNPEIHDLMMSADLIVGMNSVILVEAHLLGCKVLSIQPCLKGKNLLPNLDSIKITEPAAPKVARLVYEMVGLE